MPRAERIWYPEAIYHIIQRGNNQQDIFLEDGDYRWFLNTLGEVKKEVDFLIYGYVLMGNHYHLIMRTPNEHISTIMHMINSRYAIRFNTKYQRKGHLFQGRYKGILVDKDEYLLELSRYVHLNPVKAGLVTRSEAYPWSSYRAYADKMKDPLVTTDLILEQLAGDKKGAGKSYADFVQEKIDASKEEDDWLEENVRRQRFLGNKQFIKSALAKNKS